MRRAKLGELLSHMVPLSGLDVEEILQEQKATHQRFGEIAISWGLCQPQDIWRAWVLQNGDKLERVDLSQIGVDTQALVYLDRSLAVRCCAVPVRVFDEVLVVALADPLMQAEIAAALQAHKGKRSLKCVLADPAEIEWAIETYYPRSTVSA